MDKEQKKRLINNMDGTDNLDKLIIIHKMLDQIEYLTSIYNDIRVKCKNNQIENFQFEWICKNCGNWNSEPLVDNQGNDYCFKCDELKD
jgi:hypothetical protein